LSFLGEIPVPQITSAWAWPLQRVLQQGDVWIFLLLKCRSEAESRISRISNRISKEA
jgi:hypothetical protein